MKNELNLMMGNRIRRKREQLGYTRETFSEMVGISFRFLTDIELGRRGMSFKTLIKICNLLHTSTDYIILGKETKKEFPEIIHTLENLDEKYLPMIEDMLNVFIKTINISENEDKNNRSESQ